MQQLSGTRQRAAVLLAAVLLLLTTTNVVLLAQNLGAAPQLNVAVQGQTGAQPEGAFLNLVNWIGNVIAPVGAALAIAGGLVAYIAGRGALRYVVTALGCLAVSGVTRLLEFWINQGGGGVSERPEGQPTYGWGAGDRRTRTPSRQTGGKRCHPSHTTSCACCCS